MKCHCFRNIYFFRLLDNLLKLCPFQGGHRLRRATHELFWRRFTMRLFAYYIQTFSIDYYALPIDLRYVSC